MTDLFESPIKEGKRPDFFESLMTAVRVIANLCPLVTVQVYGCGEGGVWGLGRFILVR